MTLSAFILTGGKTVGIGKRDGQVALASERLG